MADKISKTAKQSMKKGTKVLDVRKCPKCGDGMIATKIVFSNIPGNVYRQGETLDVKLTKGMYWICKKCDLHERIRS